jgi:hypothetical protein
LLAVGKPGSKEATKGGCVATPLPRGRQAVATIGLAQPKGALIPQPRVSPGTLRYPSGKAGSIKKIYFTLKESKIEFGFSDYKTLNRRPLLSCRLYLIKVTEKEENKFLFFF